MSIQIPGTPFVLTEFAVIRFPVEIRTGGGRIRDLSREVVSHPAATDETRCRPLPVETGIKGSPCASAVVNDARPGNPARQQPNR